MTSGLTATESYRVTLAVTTPSGGLHTLDPLERLSILPRDSQPMLVALGVLSGGHEALFAVEPGTLVSGPGRCIPGPMDCQVLALAANQIETISPRGAGSGSPGASFAVTAIAVHRYPNVADALAARSKLYPPGQALLRSTKLKALARFRYEVSLGAVVDLRSKSNSGFTG